MNRRGTQVPEALLRLQQQLEDWRATQSVRTKLPEPFWQSAVELAGQYGLNPTAKALRLDYGALKKRASGVSGRPAKTSPASFVELLAPRVAPCEECIVEFESARGSKMRIPWKSSTPPAWANLMRAWRDADR